MSLERRCRLLARAYPAGPRAEEVLTTLLDANAGRRSPRPADALNVVWHGGLARLGDRTAGTRFGRWGDAASVAVVLGVLVQAATALAVLGTGLWPHHNRFEPIPREQWFASRNFLRITLDDPREITVAIVTALLAVALAAAACLGRARLARLLAAGGALAGLGVYLVERALEGHRAYTSVSGRLVMGAGVAVALTLLGTSAVARAARVVPRWWCALAAGAAVAAAGATLLLRPTQFGRGRAGLVLTAYVAGVVAVFAIALPLARAWPMACAGAALLAVPATPAVLHALAEWNTVTPRALVVLALTGVAWLVLAGLAALVLRPVSPR